MTQLHSKMCTYEKHLASNVTLLKNKPKIKTAPSFPLPCSPQLGLFSTFLVPQSADPATFFFFLPGAIFIMLHICLTQGDRAYNLKKGEWSALKLCI